MTMKLDNKLNMLNISAEYRKIDINLMQISLY